MFIESENCLNNYPGFPSFEYALEGNCGNRLLASWYLFSYLFALRNPPDFNCRNFHVILCCNFLLNFFDDSQVRLKYGINKRHIL
jgi:hypothetical protein